MSWPLIIDVPEKLFRRCVRGSSYFYLNKKTKKWAASWSLTDEKQYGLHESLDESVSETTINILSS